ncbi:uncharacterized protein [Dermacentor andersoni]|uniref:uncharacterized protein n=1 Tax=Dermacentor andersoni TaxID=34620 RepID=UPI0021554F39|nr:uncharacterized protein LOC126541272 [Dermacentor andersoni]
MKATRSGKESPEEFLTAETDAQERGMTTMMTMNISTLYSDHKSADQTAALSEERRSRQPGAIVTATVVRTALVGVSIYQSKALRQCGSFSILFLLLLLLWLFTWLATGKSGRTTTATASAETSIVAFDTTHAPISNEAIDTTHAPTSNEATNGTVLLDGFETLSLLNDMTVPNHVLDIDSFPE